MPLDYDSLMTTAITDAEYSYTDQDAMLYAMGVGFGSDPLNEQELSYVYEKHLSTVPTLATIVASESLLADCGWDYSQMLHGQQWLELYRPLPAAAELIASHRVAAAYDKGPGRGAVICIETDARLKKDDTALFTLGSTLMARGDGGFGGPSGSPPAPHRVPVREPDLSCDLLVRPDQALIYRLSGDRNPLHVDLQVAGAAGFDKPILHGLCTYGIACRAILKTICDYDFTLITGFDARFSAPVMPGDLLTTEMWQERNVVSFRCSVKARDVIVIKNGKCTLSG
jgi:acyl dehydratase